MNKVLERLIRWSLVLATMAGIAVTQKPQSAEAGFYPDTKFAKVNEYPSLVLIRIEEYFIVDDYTNTYWTIGVLLNNSHVLTGANYLTNKFPATRYTYTVFSGNPISKFSQSSRVSRIFVHPLHQNMEPEDVNYNLAIIRLAKPFKFNASVQSTKLNSNNNVFNKNQINTFVVLYCRETDMNCLPVKQSVTMEDPYICSFGFQRAVLVRCAHTFHAGTKRGGFLFKNINGIQYLTGVGTSSSPFMPLAYFTKIADFRSWITSVIR